MDRNVYEESPSFKVQWYDVDCSKDQHSPKLVLPVLSFSVSQVGWE